MEVMEVMEKNVISSPRATTAMNNRLLQGGGTQRQGTEPPRSAGSGLFEVYRQDGMA